VRFTTQYGYNDAGIYPNVSLSATANGNAPPTSVNPPGSISSANLAIFQGMYNDLLGRISSVTQTYYSNLQQWQRPARRGCATSYSTSTASSRRTTGESRAT